MTATYPSRRIIGPAHTGCRLQRVNLSRCQAEESLSHLVLLLVHGRYWSAALASPS